MTVPVSMMGPVSMSDMFFDVASAPLLRSAITNSLGSRAVAAVASAALHPRSSTGVRRCTNSYHISSRPHRSNCSEAIHLCMTGRRPIEPRNP